MVQASQGKTGTSDVTYDLVSILYHALQGAETYDQYIRDAEQRGDNELAIINSFRTPKKKTAAARIVPSSCLSSS